MYRNLLPSRFVAISSLLLALCGLPVAFAQAQPESAEAVAIRGLLTSTQPTIAITSILPSPVSGLYQVELDMIVYEAVGERKATLTVFTDVDCPYCRKLHGEVEALNNYGIAVRYLAYPRTGLIDRSTGQKTETYVRMVSTWCSEDRKVMMTTAKRGADIPLTDCESPVEEQFELGREVGVTGTPALVLEDGTMLPGYVPADTLAGYLLGNAAQ